ncbi:hypothetical protein [Pedobacter heparinus]|uniref:hypothetical protein n=1 Tax=Pedobacter heparinus TaxID=984 RepID=UPI00292E4218|nr:hypothetical protein [Pedobacter heparinus]
MNKTEENNLDHVAALSASLLDVAYLGDVLPFYHTDDLLFLLMKEFKHLSQEKDKELAMAKYQHSKTQLLQLQERILKLLTDAGKRQRKVIVNLNEELTRMMNLLELIKTERIDPLFLPPKLSKS